MVWLAVISGLQAEKKKKEKAKEAAQKMMRGSSRGSVDEQAEDEFPELDLPDAGQEGEPEAPPKKRSRA